MHLYSEKTVDTHCMDFLQGIWEPLLEYVSSEYGPPRQLNDMECLKFSSKEATVSAKNWVYEVPKEYDMKGSAVYKYLTSIIKHVPGVKPGYTCLLKVSIPAKDTHAFWRLDPAMESEYKLFIWDMAEDALEFEICYWGLDDEHAKFNVTCHAKDIVRNIRSHLNSSRPCTELLQSEVLKTSEQKKECEIFQIGEMLNKDWKSAGEAFNFTLMTKERSLIIFGYNKLLSLHPGSTLLRYYSVFPPLSIFALTIDIFPDQDETIPRGSGNFYIIVERDIQRTNSSLDTRKVWKFHH